MKALTLIILCLALTQSGCKKEPVKTAHFEEIHEKIKAWGNQLKVTLSLSPDGTFEDVLFKNPQKIFAFVTFPETMAGNHLLEAHWVRPDGEIQENAFFYHDFSSTPSKKMHFWIGFPEPLTIEEPLHKNGQWAVHIYCDKQLVASSTFTITNN